MFIIGRGEIWNETNTVHLAVSPVILSDFLGHRPWRLYISIDGFDLIMTTNVSDTKQRIYKAYPHSTFQNSFHQAGIILSVNTSKKNEKMEDHCWCTQVQKHQYISHRNSAKENIIFSSSLKFQPNSFQIDDPLR